MAAKKPHVVPENLSEEYYQITPDIMGSFSKFRPELNLYRFREDVARIDTYYKLGERLSNEQVDALSTLVAEGFIFVSRSDHPIYVKHISHQLDLILVDKNLKESEIADIIVEALTMRLAAFFEQPVKALADRLRDDVLVLTEYLWHDVHRIRGLIRRLHPTHNLAHHSYNSGVVGLALFLRLNADDFKNQTIKRRLFDNLATGLFIHDLGMTKIPQFVREKAQRLTVDEQNKVLQHTRVGYTMLDKLDLRYNEVEACVSDHHERLDGSGYPQKSRGMDVSFFGRLCAVADSFAAMTAARPYAKVMSQGEAAADLVRDEKHYDPRITKALAAIIMAEQAKG